MPLWLKALIIFSVVCWSLTFVLALYGDKLPTGPTGKHHYE